MAPFCWSTERPQARRQSWPAGRRRFRPDTAGSKSGSIPKARSGTDLFAIRTIPACRLVSGCCSEPRSASASACAPPCSKLCSERFCSLFRSASIGGWMRPQGGGAPSPGDRQRRQPHRGRGLQPPARRGQAEGQEFAMIAAAINAMLERIEELVEQLRLVTDLLAHDLRSPLTRMRANIERAADLRDRGARAAGARGDFNRHRSDASPDLRNARDQQRRGRHGPPAFRGIRSCRVSPRHLRDLPAGRRGARACRSRQRLNPTSPYFGNRQMIGRAIANLVDNALHYGGRSDRARRAKRDEFVDIVGR